MTPILGTKVWKPARVESVHASPCSYIDRMAGDKLYRRNRRDIRSSTQGTHEKHILNKAPKHSDESDEEPEKDHIKSRIQPMNDNLYQEQTGEGGGDVNSSSEPAFTARPKSDSSLEPYITRSGRPSRHPDRLDL
jgi:hypothetical protein